MRKQLLLLLFSLFAVVGYARTVTGVITSAVDKLPVIGASISVEGTTRGTTTDLDGKYSIKVAPDATLTVSCIGFRTLDVPVNSRSQIDVTMALDNTSLEENSALVLSCVCNFNLKALAGDNACIANLAAAFTVERSFIENKYCALALAYSLYTLAVLYNSENFSLSFIFAVAYKLSFCNVCKVCAVAYPSICACILSHIT